MENREILSNMSKQHQSTLCLRKSQRKNNYIRWFDKNNGILIREIKCQCAHNNWYIGCIFEHPVDPGVIIETCYECSKIRSYNMSTGESSDINTGTAVRAICTSPASSILGADVIGHILQFKWKDGGEELELVHSVETNITNIRCMCYVEQNDAVVLSCRYPGRVCHLI